MPLTLNAFPPGMVCDHTKTQFCLAGSEELDVRQVRLIFLNAFETWTELCCLWIDLFLVRVWLPEKGKM